MARKSQDLRRIEAAEADVSSEIDSLEARLIELRGKQEKLQTAKSVIQELSGSTLADAAEEAFDEVEHEEEEGDQPSGGPPEEDLTIGELALMILEAENSGLGMTSSEILDAIRKDWLPELARTSLSPPLSRLKKKGIIELDGEHWRLAAKNEAKDDDF